MRGYTAKKGERYYAVIYEGVDPATGKDRRRWYDSYRRNIDRHVVPAIGRVPLQRLTPEDLDGLYTLLAAAGPDGRRGLAPKTIHSIHGMLHKALADAERKGSIVRNVADLADPPKLSSAKKPEMRVWDGIQLRRFLDGIHEHRLHPAYYLAANTGMRRGEILGLRWKDVDLDAQRLSVNQAVTSLAYVVQIADVKTGSGRRTIDLDNRTVGVLRSWRKRQLEE